MRVRIAAASTAMCAALALVAIPALPAMADDATPSPSASAAPTPTPSPSVPTTPTPDPTTPTPDPTTPTTPAAPITPAAEPPRRELPLKAGHFGHLVDLAQQRLTWLGYDIYEGNLENQRFGESTKSAVRAFQVKFFLPATGKVDRKTWNRLRELANPIGILPRSCTSVPVALCLDKTAKLLRYVVDGKVKLTTDVRFGLPGMDTREGTFRVYWKSRNHTSSRYNSWMPFAMFFSGGQAVHYSPYFDRDGYNGGSHGCVGIRDIKLASWLFDRVPTGSRVYVYRS
ncbi:MAG: L,D-transpeptidase family protein [Actinomycetota bacterium]|nr:L,D-transpeptidase family protein [Actinomycetota bacterium]